MAGRDGPIDQPMDSLKRVTIVMPYPLWILIKYYDKTRIKHNINTSCVELLETHPALVSLINQLYNGLEAKGGTNMP